MELPVLSSDFCLNKPHLRPLDGFVEAKSSGLERSRGLCFSYTSVGLSLELSDEGGRVAYGIISQGPSTIKLLYLDKDYLMVVASTHHILYSFLPDVQGGVADLGSALRVAARSIWWWCFTLEDPRGFEDSVPDHGSFSIPEDVAQIKTIAHLLKVLIRILSMLRW